jgi:hypothetical protein
MEVHCALENLFLWLGPSAWKQSNRRETGLEREVNAEGSSGLTTLIIA